MPARFSPKSSASIDKMALAQLKAYAKAATSSCKGRGSSIARLYWALQQTIDNHPNATAVVGDQSLRHQLTQARALLAQRMGGPAPAAAASSSSSSSAAAGLGQDEDLDGNGNGDPKQKHQCMICWTDFDDGEKKPVALSCGHILCETCACKEQETRAKCPACRKTFTSFLPLFF